MGSLPGMQVSVKSSDKQRLLQRCGRINSTGKVMFYSFFIKVTLKDFCRRIKSCNNLVKHNSTNSIAELRVTSPRCSCPRSTFQYVFLILNVYSKDPIHQFTQELGPVSINPDIFETANFLRVSAFRPHESSESPQRNGICSKVFKTAFLDGTERSRVDD